MKILKTYLHLQNMTAKTLESSLLIERKMLRCLGASKLVCVGFLFQEVLPTVYMV